MRPITAQELARHGRRAARLAAIRLVRLAEMHHRWGRLSRQEAAEYAPAWEALANDEWDQSVVTAAAQYLINRGDWVAAEAVHRLLAEFGGRVWTSTGAACRLLDEALTVWMTTRQGAAFLDRLENDNL